MSVRVERRKNRRGEGQRLREDIVQAAAGLLDVTGSVEAVTLRAVAREVGISAPSIYAHFPDAESMVFAVVQEAFAALRVKLQGAFDQTAGDPVDRLRAVCQAYLDFAEMHPQRYRVMFGGLWSAVDAQGSPSIAGEAAQIGQTEFDILAGALASCVDAGTSRSTNFFDDAVVLWTGLHGLATLRPVTLMFPWPDHTAERLVDRLALLTPT